MNVKWIRSSYSGSQGECVEMATLPDGSRAVRHSRRPQAEVIIYTAAEWRAFLAGAKDGEFD